MPNVNANILHGIMHVEWDILPRCHYNTKKYAAFQPERRSSTHALLRAAVPMRFVPTGCKPV